MYPPLSGFSRRTFHRLCAGALLFSRQWLRAADGAPLNPVLTWDASPDAATGQARKYRADAEIILFSVPLLHRAGVGDGFAGWRESASANGASVRLLEFAGRSIPEHAAGLNRFGYIQELSRMGGNTCAESIYFGVMTSSPEESAAEAKKALNSTAKEAAYSAIEGRISAGSIETARTHFVARNPASAAEQNELIGRARQEIVGAPKNKMQIPAGDPSAQPFLHALAGLLNQTETSETHYAYNGRRYRLRVSKTADPKAARAFQQSGLIAGGAAVTRVLGSLCREDGGKPIEFRLWIEQGVQRPIPLRIEYQPKAYLRLTFEAQA